MGVSALPPVLHPGDTGPYSANAVAQGTQGTATKSAVSGMGPEQFVSTLESVPLPVFLEGDPVVCTATAEPSADASGTSLWHSPPAATVALDAIMDRWAAGAGVGPTIDWPGSAEDRPEEVSPLLPSAVSEAMGWNGGAVPKVGRSAVNRSQVDAVMGQPTQPAVLAGSGTVAVPQQTGPRLPASETPTHPAQAEARHQEGGRRFGWVLSLLGLLSWRWSTRRPDDDRRKVRRCSARGQQVRR
jgi:hypothetical protein